MNGIWSDGRHGHQIRIDVLVEHRAIVEDATLRVNVLDVVLGGDAQDALRFVRSAEVELPDEFGGQSLNLEIRKNYH